MTGTGEPSAAVNMVRKHADSKTVTGSLSGSYGSWDKRRVVADVSAPLTTAGNVRTRVITGYQDGNSWLDRYGKRKKFFTGALDADLTAMTTLSVGYDYQQAHTSSPTWGGVPTWYADGGRTHFDRSFSPAPDWSYSEHKANKVFASLAQRFDNGWLLNATGTHAENRFDSKLMYASGFPDRATGGGVSAFGGWNKGKRKLDSLDMYASGPVTVFERQHTLMLGGSYSKQNNHYINAQSSFSADEVGDYFRWNGRIAEKPWSPWVDYSNDTIRKRSLYGAARITLADPLHAIVGARYTHWRASGTTANSDKSRITPYAGLIYDINDSWSGYASYTSIFQPQSVRNIDKRYIDPATGNSYETGLKGDWLNGRLTASVALFYTRQDNVAVRTSEYIPGTDEMAWRAANDTVSKGVEFELNGKLTDDWLMTVGGSRFMAQAGDHTAINPWMPRTTLKLFTRYRLPILPALTLGGGVNWQNSTWQDVAGPQGAARIHQGSYALVDLFGRYQVTQRLAVQANVNNLFDKENFDYLGAYAVYGAPRSVSVAVNYDF